MFATNKRHLSYLSKYKISALFKLFHSKNELNIILYWTKIFTMDDHVRRKCQSLADRIFSANNKILRVSWTDKSDSDARVLSIRNHQKTIHVESNEYQNQRKAFFQIFFR